MNDHLREGVNVKKRTFYGQADRKGGGGWILSVLGLTAGGPES